MKSRKLISNLKWNIEQNREFPKTEAQKTEKQF